MHNIKIHLNKIKEKIHDQAFSSILSRWPNYCILRSCKHYLMLISFTLELSSSAVILSSGLTPSIHLNILAYILCYVCLLICTCLPFKLAILFQFTYNTTTLLMYPTRAKLVEDGITGFLQSAQKKKKTLWPLFMDGVQLLQG